MIGYALYSIQFSQAMDMYKVSSKRQITIPKAFCLSAGINPGDMVEFFAYRGQITVVKQQPGSSAGVLQHLRSDPNIIDTESLLDGLQHLPVTTSP